MSQSARKSVGAPRLSLRRGIALLAVSAAALGLTLVPAGSAAGGPVFIANAGVLGNMVTGLKTLVPGVTITNQTGGSVALSQSIAVGTLNPEIFGSADADVHRSLNPPNGTKETWFAAFARNAIVMQYSPSATNPHAAAFAQAAAGTIPWYQPLITGPPISTCRMSPDADPSGYYTLFVLQLASEFYGLPTLKQQVLGDDRNPAQMTPACSAGGKTLANGGLDVSFTYLSGAVGGTTPYIVLPDQINLSNPAFADFYAHASFTNTAGVTFHGNVIRPGIAPIVGAANPDGAHDVLRYVFENRDSLLSTYHFLPTELYAGGDPSTIPTDLRPFFDLRRMEVTVVTPSDWCKTSNFTVSGDGVTATAVTKDRFLGCHVTLDVATGATGVRDLTLTWKVIRVLGQSIPLTLSFPGVVDLTNAIPVKPAFLS
jgi:molybdate/tungstate transport system substrate-binding protein